MTYLMESASEADRLLKKSDYESSKQQLLMTGLREGMTALDAGGGAGFVSKIISEIVGTTGNVILCDQSADRLKSAQSYCAGTKNLSYLESSLEKIRLDDECVDYVFCRFVFEYLLNSEIVFNELVRVLRPGGKLVIGDLDYNMMSHYPLEPELETQLNKMMSSLVKAKLWDPFSGRKIYHHFYRAKMEQIQVNVVSHHLIYGESSQRDVDNWAAKLSQMSSLVSQGLLKLDFDFPKFQKRFLDFFRSPERFSYSPLILVDGIKPSRNI